MWINAGVYESPSSPSGTGNSPSTATTPKLQWGIEIGVRVSGSVRICVCGELSRADVGGKGRESLVCCRCIERGACATRSKVKTERQSRTSKGSTNQLCCACLGLLAFFFPSLLCTHFTSHPPPIYVHALIYSLASLPVPLCCPPPRI